MKSLGLVTDQKELNDTLKLIDQNQNGLIEFEEFVQLMQALNKGESPEEELKEAFKAFDRNNDSLIVEADLIQAIKLVGLKMTDAEIRQLITEAGLF
jgi:calmodulin